MWKKEKGVGAEMCPRRERFVFIPEGKKAAKEKKSRGSSGIQKIKFWEMQLGISLRKRVMCAPTHVVQTYYTKKQKE